MYGSTWPPQARSVCTSSVVAVTPSGAEPPYAVMQLPIIPPPPSPPVFRADLPPALGLVMERALAKLNDQDCEIIVMRHHEQLSNQEAAQALGLSEPAVSMRYLRALRRLRALLVDPQADPESLEVGG